MNLSACVLLYPADEFAAHESVDKDDVVANPAKMQTAKHVDKKNEKEQLLVLDGTWRKSRKMMHLNPWLNMLPRFSIQGESGAYSIRKAESLHQLSTFESVTHALKFMQADPELEKLDSVFDHFVSMYLKNIPAEKRGLFLRNKT